VSGPEALRPEVEWSLLCDYCLIDIAGKLTLVGIFDRLVVPALPVHAPLLVVVTRWRAPASDRFVAETRIWTPTEQLLVTTGPVDVAVPAAGPAMTVNQFRAVTFERAGQYLVELLAQGDTARYYPCEVVVHSPPS
jgi:hypothetical protein